MLDFLSIFSMRFLGILSKYFLILFSLFSIHFSFGSPLQNVDPNMITSIIGNLTQVMGQSEAECGTKYEDIKPTNEDFCSDLNTQIKLYKCPAGASISPILLPPPCSQFVGSVGQQGIMDEVDKAVEQTLENGKAVCHCCMVPSICLMGGIGRVIDLLRVGNYAGLLMGLNNNKICAAVEKAQHASMGLDLMSGGKCLHKGGRCKETHGICVEKLEELKTNINTMVVNPSKNCPTISGPIDCSNELGQLEDKYIAELEASSDQKCGTATKAGQSQLVQAALTGVASLVARECKKDHERNTKCDDKKDVELDECCERHSRADACKQDKCEGEQGADLDSCCATHPDSTICTGHVDSSNVCHATQLMLDPTSCMEKCREDSTVPGCVGFCNLQWHNEICPEVCKTYQMPRCEEETGPGNACDSVSDQVCCSNPNGPDCDQFCLDNPDSTYCQCASNSGRCRCDREEDAPYIPEGQCSTTLPSVECEDPDDPACALGGTDSNNFLGDDSGDEGGNAGGTPWAGPPPFLDSGGDDSGENNANSGSSPTTYSSGGGSGGGGLGGGGLGGGSGGGSDSGEEGEGVGEEGDDPYENILAGLSGDQNQSPGYSGGSSGGRGGRAGSGFDLKKFLPKKKKGKKPNSKNSANRAPTSVDNIFDISSQIIGRYCTNNNMNCIQE